MSTLEHSPAAAGTRWIPVAARRHALLAGCVAACLLIWIWRRPGQLAHPYVWAEESYILRNFLDDGWQAAFQPVQGYLQWPSTFLVPLSAQVSFGHLPGLMYAFATLVFVLTVVMLVGPESRWGDRRMLAAMAVGAALVPVNPEVFGVLLYSFWWATLWPLIILGWRRDLWGARAPALVVAALSSPAAGALFVLYALEYRRGRKLRDAISAAILFAGFAIELALAVHSPRGETLSTDASFLEVSEQALRTGGFFATTFVSHADRGFMSLAGAVFLLFLVGAALAAATRTRREAVLLLTGGALIFTALSSVPAPLISDPVAGGPRYFFLPFVAFVWVLLQLAADVRLGWIRTAAIALLATAFLGLATTFSRSPRTTEAKLSWTSQLRRCAAEPGPVATIPIYFDGSTTFWKLRLERTHCAAD